MHRYRKGIMQACLQMRTFLYLYRAQARSEKERSGFELGMARKPKGRGPAANPNEGGKRWLKSRLLLPVWS